MRTLKRPGHGFALPLVLWLIVVLMTMIGLLAYSARIGHIQARSQYDRIEGEAAAKAGIAYAVARMDPGLATEAWYPSMAPRELVLDGFRIAITIRDEAGKFDLNAGSPELFAALLRARQVPAEQAAPLIAGITRLRQQHVQWGNNPLPPVRRERIDSVSELRQWPGVSATTLALLAEDLTVYAAAPQPQWRLASPSMQQALAEIGQGGVDTAPAAGAEFGSGTYAIESVAERPGKPPARVRAVLRAFPRVGGGMASTWLAWENGRWVQ